MSCIYTDVTPSPTSSAAATMSITFAYADVKKAYENYDFVRLDFNAQNLVLGLTNVKLEKTATSGNAYKLYEVVGGFDVTGIYGPLIATAGADVLNGSTTAATSPAATSPTGSRTTNTTAKATVEAQEMLMSLAARFLVGMFRVTEDSFM